MPLDRECQASESTHAANKQPRNRRAVDRTSAPHLSCNKTPGEGQKIDDIKKSPPSPYRDEKGRLLKGTPPVNPLGRPKGIHAQVRALIGDNGEKALQVLADIMLDTKARPRDRTECAKTLLERGFGKPIEIQAIASLQGDDEATRLIASDALMKLAGALQGKAIPPSTITVDAEITDGSAAVDALPPKPET